MTGRRRGLLDTSVVIALGSLDPASLPDVCLISAVTLAELTAGPLVAAAVRERAIRQARLQAVERSFDPLPFDADCARAFGRVSADLRARGRKAAARPYDGLIAATALAHGLDLYTLNPGDFDGIGGLTVRAPNA
jgi:predicted nucleic acid-binding protein